MSGQKQETEKADLIRDMGSANRDIALQAVEILRKHGWLTDGSLRKADLAGANLQGANLKEADLAGANLFKANLDATILSNANLSQATLDGARMAGADLQEANLENADLDEAYLVGGNLQNANLQRCPMVMTNLSRANLSGAVLSGSLMIFTKLDGVDLTKINLKGVNVEQEVLVNLDLRTIDLAGIQVITTISPESQKSLEPAPFVEYALALRDARTNNDEQEQIDSSIRLGNYFFDLEQMSFTVNEDPLSWRIGHNIAYLPKIVNFALLYYSQAWDLLKMDASNRKQGLVLKRLGTLRLKLGQPKQAIAHYQAASDVFRELGLEAEQTQVAESLGYAHSYFGDPIPASNHLQQALELNAKHGDTKRGKRLESILLPAPHIVVTDRNLVHIDEEGLLRYWALPDGRLVNSTSLGTFDRLAIAPDARLAATAIHERQEYTVKIWQCSDGRCINQFSVPHSVETLFIRPDNKILAILNNHRYTAINRKDDHFAFVQFWNIDTGELIDTLDLPLPGPCTVAPFFLADDWQTATIGLTYASPYSWDRIRLYVCTLNQEFSFSGENNDFINRYQDSFVTAVSLNDKAGLLALGMHNADNEYYRKEQLPGYNIHLWRKARHFPITPISIILFPFKLLLWVVVFLVTRDFSIITDPFTGLRSRRKTSWMQSLSATFASIFTGRLKFKKSQWLSGHTGRINWMLFSQDKQWLFSGGDDGSVRSWRLPSGQLSTTMTDHEQGVTTGALHPNGELLVTGDRGGTVCVWQIPEGARQQKIKAHDTAVLFLEASPNGNYLVSGSGVQITVWHWQEGVLQQTSLV